MPNASTSARFRALASVATLLAERGPVAHGAAAASGRLIDGPHFADVQQLIAAAVVPAAGLPPPGAARQAPRGLESLRRGVRLGPPPHPPRRSLGEGLDRLA